MIRPVRSRTVGLFDINNLVNDFTEYEVEKVKKKSKVIKDKKAKEEPKVAIKADFRVSSKKAKNSKAKDEFLNRLEDGLFNEFTKKDWLMYWQHKAEQYGVKYIIMKGNYPKEYAILGSIMDNFPVDEVKLMIDFLWDCEHDIHPKKTMGTWILSKGWINGVYQSAIQWRDGEYKTQAELKRQAYQQPTRNREWVSDTEQTTNTKSSSKIRI